MEPIISPWFFYFIDVAQALDNLFFVLLICSSFISLMCGVAWCSLTIDPDFYNAYGKEKERWFRRTKISVACTIGFGLITAAIPSSETLYKMLVASMVTPDNIQIVQDNAVKFISDVANAVMKKGN